MTDYLGGLILIVALAVGTAYLERHLKEETVRRLVKQECLK